MMHRLHWSLTLQIVACMFHAVAIVCTVFRLAYRWWLARFWWEDGWAAFALALDVWCLVATWLDAPKAERSAPPLDRIIDWMLAFLFPCVVWSCRISILLSIVRIANPPQLLRRITFFIAGSFIIMCAALIGQKIPVCIKHHCRITASVGLSQLIMDVVSDSVLVFLPVYLLRQTKINDQQRVLIYSVFSASLLITTVTVFHSIVLFKLKALRSDGIIIIGHVKVAVSLIVCNLLVIVAFFCRIARRGKVADAEAMKEVISFTDVDLNTGFTESSADKCTATVSHSWATTMSHLTTRSSEVEHKPEELEGTMRPGSAHGPLSSPDSVRRDDQ